MSLFFIYLLAAIVWIFVGIVAWKLPNIIGFIGEDFVRSKLEKLDKGKYIVLHDVLIPSTGNTKTTQIDHVVISNYGIFCIETKAHKGWIFGNARSQYWTQVIYRYKKRFYNPLRQNYAHIKALEAILSPTFPNVSIKGFVALPRASKIKVSGSDDVGYAKDVLDKVQSFAQEVFTDEQKQRIVSIINQNNIQDKQGRKEHIREVRNRLS